MQIGSVGWMHPQWGGSFYPESLPEDWWLTYYSNEFPCVLVPAAAVRRENAGQWLADTHPQFRFFLEVDAVREAGLATALSVASTLASRLAGVICTGIDGIPVTDSQAANQLAARGVKIAIDQAVADHPWIRSGIASPAWRPGAVCTGCSVGVVSQLPRGDRRGLRACIEDFARQAGGADPTYLFIDGPQPDAESLKDAVVIADLLGV